MSPHFPSRPRCKLSGLTVWNVFELWIEGRKPAASKCQPMARRLRQSSRTIRQRDAATITSEEAQQWADGLTTAERSAHVVHEVWLRAARTLFAWAVKRRKLASNPFAETSVPVPKRAPKLREREFNEGEWRTILRATLEPPSPRMESHNAAARRWVPWLCAYTGSRPGEACQLRAEDVRQHKDGFSIINITPEAGTVKGNVARVVPLHEHLVEQGFIAFAQAKRSGPLFYDPDGRRKADDDPTNRTRQPWVKARDKISEWVRALGVNDPGISPNHAWRHTYKRRRPRERALSAALGLPCAGIHRRKRAMTTRRRRSKTWPPSFSGSQDLNSPTSPLPLLPGARQRMCRDAGIGEELHDALTGHSGGEVGRSYGGGFGLKALAEAIAKIPVPSGAQGEVWRRGDYQMFGGSPLGNDL